MTAALVISALLLASGTVAAWLWLERPPCVKQRVIVNLKAEQDAGYQGILWSSRGAWLTLKDVTAFKAERPPAKVDGDAVFHRDAVLFIQILPGGEG